MLSLVRANLGDAASDPRGEAGLFERGGVVLLERGRVKVVLEVLEREGVLWGEEARVSARCEMTRRRRTRTWRMSVSVTAVSRSANSCEDGAALASVTAAKRAATVNFIVDRGRVLGRDGGGTNTERHSVCSSSL